MISRIGRLSGEFRGPLFRFSRKSMFRRDLEELQLQGRSALVVRALARKLQRMQGA